MKEFTWTYMVDQLMYADTGIRSKIEELGRDILLGDVPAGWHVVDGPVGRWRDVVVDGQACKEYRLAAWASPAPGRLNVDAAILNEAARIGRAELDAELDQTLTRLAGHSPAARERRSS